MGSSEDLWNLNLLLRHTWRPLQLTSTALPPTTTPAPASLPHSLIAPDMFLVFTSSKKVKLGYCLQHPPRPGKPHITVSPLGILVTSCWFHHCLASYAPGCWEWRGEAALTVSSVLFSPMRRRLTPPF